ncbi:MAG: DUF5651 domain-containing protein [Caloramator sp.]|nr:DUF5651 domain-containing protein [Caloramator sp.]
MTAGELVEIFMDEIKKALLRRNFSKVRITNFIDEVGLAVEARLKGGRSDLAKELVFENVRHYSPKRFLSYNERKEYMQLQVTNAALVSLAETFEKSGLLSKEAKKNLKAAQSYLFKAIREINNMLDEKELDKHDRFLRKFRIALLDTENVVDRDKIRKIEQYGDKFVLTHEEFLQLAENAIEITCKNCNKEDYKNCRYFNLMFELEVDPINQNGCPYRME